MIGIFVDRPRISAAADGRVLSGYDMELIDGAANRAGLMRNEYEVRALSSTPDHVINDQNYNVIVTLDNGPLKHFTGKSGVDKWQLSPLDALPEFKCRRIIPSYHPDRIKKEWPMKLYLEMSLKRARLNNRPGPWDRVPERFMLDPSFDYTISVLESLIDREWLSLDIETSWNQINTFGVAWSESDAIAVKCLPEMPVPQFHKLWDTIRRVCEGPSRKIMSNGIFERMYFSRYGIRVENFTHDVQVAMKVLWPELKKSLANAGRIYTMKPYWKDDGKVESEEEGKKDWNNIKDWQRHFLYNCRDTTGTLIAAHAQRADLASRGMLELYEDYISKLFDPTFEMCAAGLPINREVQARLVSEYEAKSAELVKSLSREINPRSSKAKIALLSSQGLKIPQKRDKETGAYRDSSDELTLKKMRLHYPENRDIRSLIEIAGIEKALSSYLRVRTFDDARIRFMLDPCGTETGRMSCSSDPWGGGFNAQTMTGYLKQMVEWPADADRTFIEIDLRQAETRFVAFDADETTLLGMLERDEDIHRFVAAEIYGKPMAEISHDERQLGKKSGHGANYNMGVNTFIDSCLKEMDLVLDRKMATRVLESYHKLFPGIRRWHSRIRDKVYSERRLSNPFGRIRYFYGRADDNTYREAYAYRPQSTVPDIINHLMLGLADRRTEGALDFTFHMQCHDSLLVSCPVRYVEKIVDYVQRATWHPVIELKAGRLIIPTEIKSGQCLGRMTKIKV